MKRVIFNLVIIGGMLFPVLAHGAEETPSMVMDSLWVVLATVLVFFMQAGFALLEAGIHSKKNTTNVLMKNTMDFVIASLGFFAIGFAFMFGNGNSIIGTEGFFLMGETKAFSSLDWANIPLTIKFMFQLVFAGTAATIISGAIGGRVKFMGYLVLSLVITTVIYPILGKWVWGGGWVSELGFFDFAGSTVVHAVGGFAALAAVMVVGNRAGRFTAMGESRSLPSSSITFTALGTLILWLGWFGFNAGSTMAVAGNAKLIGHILLTTNLAAATGAVTAMLLGHKIYKRFDLPITLNGALAGLVGITAGCAFVDSLGAMAIGMVSGILMIYSVGILEKFRIDDVVGAFPVHGVCGVWGTAAVGLFAASPWSGVEGTPALGLFYGGEIKTFLIQLLPSLLISVIAFVSTYLVTSIIRRTIGIRVSEHHEEIGLDIAEHNHESFHHHILKDNTESYNSLQA